MLVKSLIHRSYKNTKVIASFYGRIIYYGEVGWGGGELFILKEVSHGKNGRGIPIFNNFETVQAVKLS